LMDPLALIRAAGEFTSAGHHYATAQKPAVPQPAVAATTAPVVATPVAAPVAEAAPPAVAIPAPSPATLPIEKVAANEPLTEKVAAKIEPIEVPVPVEVPAPMPEVVAAPEVVAPPPVVEPEPVVEARQPIVLVVDDSLTVRKITSRLLEREGYKAMTAKDGLDALQVLSTVNPDVILLDIEMPRMDGFEFARTIKSDNRQNMIPIIMITSRTAEKHRNHAMELGVNEYLGKPYQDDQLLGLIGKYTEHVVRPT
jgi:CheY-like chemotaxis protein